MRRGRRTRQTIMYVMVIALMLTTVAYAALQTTLNINGTVTKKGGSWDIHFANLSEPVLTGDAEVGSSTLELASFTFSASVTKPLDSIVYTFDVVNSGTIDAILDSITLTGKNEAETYNIDYTLTYEDGSTIAKGDTLKSGQTKGLKLSVSYNDVNGILDYDVFLKLGATLIYVQATDSEQEGGSTSGGETGGSDDELYKVEVTGYDYVTGYKLIIVYTNEDNLYFEYNNGNMEALADVSVSGYKYQEYDAYGNVISTDNTIYKHIYAGITPTIEGATIDDYVAKLSIAENSPTTIVTSYDVDINGTGQFDINDVTSINGIYGAYESIMYNSVKAVFKSDINRDKLVTEEETNIVMNAFEMSKRTPTISIDNTTLTITGYQGTERFEIFVDDVNVGEIFAINSSATYDLSNLPSGTHTIGVVGKISIVSSKTATISYTNL